MKQTIREKLVLMLEALDAGETQVAFGHLTLNLYGLVPSSTITRIPKPQETISGAYADGTKWEINAPMREAPAEGVKYFYARPDGETESAKWEGDADE